MKEVKMNNLRKCTLWKDTDEYYFHTWTNAAMIKKHGELASKDHIYTVTKAIIENIRTGELIEVWPDNITFITEGGSNE